VPVPQHHPVQDHLPVHLPREVVLRQRRPRLALPRIRLDIHGLPRRQPLRIQLQREHLEHRLARVHRREPPAAGRGHHPRHERVVRDRRLHHGPQRTAPVEQTPANIQVVLGESIVRLPRHQHPLAAHGHRRVDLVVRAVVQLQRPHVHHPVEPQVLHPHVEQSRPIGLVPRHPHPVRIGSGEHVDLRVGPVGDQLEHPRRDRDVHAGPSLQPLVVRDDELERVDARGQEGREAGDPLGIRWGLLPGGELSIQARAPRELCEAVQPMVVGHSADELDAPFHHSTICGSIDRGEGREVGRGAAVQILDGAAPQHHQHGHLPPHPTRPR
jgi:hypothetical protein